MDANIVMALGHSRLADVSAGAVRHSRIEHKRFFEGSSLGRNIVRCVYHCADCYHCCAEPVVSFVCIARVSVLDNPTHEQLSRSCHGLLAQVAAVPACTGSSTVVSQSARRSRASPSITVVLTSLEGLNQRRHSGRSEFEPQLSLSPYLCKLSLWQKLSPRWRGTLKEPRNTKHNFQGRLTPLNQQIEKNPRHSHSSQLQPSEKSIDPNVPLRLNLNCLLATDGASSQFSNRAPNQPSELYTFVFVSQCVVGESL